MSSEKLKVFLATFVLTAAVGATNVARADQLEISDAPLFVATSVEPNVLFMLDDSGSMRWGFMPDELDESFNIGDPWNNCGNSGRWGGVYLCYFYTNNGRQWLSSSHLNKIYYNPEAEYPPPIKPDGTTYPQADFASAKMNGYDADACGWEYDNGWFNSCIDLRSNYRALMDPYYYKRNYGRGFAISHNAEAEPAFYYVNSGDSGCEGSKKSSCYKKVSFGDGEFDAQNFANWFSYYRTREMVAKAGVSFAFHEQGSGMRVGYGSINDNGLARGVRGFEGDDREDFFDWLYSDEANGGTPLREALERTGEYFEREQPWRTDPTDSRSELLTCRQSYTVLMTDGYYDAYEDVDAGNADGNAGETIAGPGGQSYRYSPSSPFSDDRSNTLADVAMDFWKRDLRDDIDNEVPTTESNPAFWQHMVTFGVGLGVEGTISSDDAFDAITDDGIDIDWPNPSSSRPGKIDDLLHAAVNSRGGFFNASDPQQFAVSLSQILSEVIARANATTSVAVSSTRLDAGAFVYRALFDSENWSGELIAEDVYEETVYRATDKLASMGFSGRKVFTFVPDDSGEDDPDGIGDGSAMEFGTGAADDIRDRLAIDDGADTDLWNAENLISYIRGDDTLEGEDGFRERSVMLGDIVNSRPVASTAGNEGWGRVDDDYLDYIAGHKNDPRDCPDTGDCDYSRRDTVFVGANDGMLHAFDARNLKEYFAYVPASVHGNLKHLAERDYTHKYFVDGQIAVGDANFDGSWGTYLVGTLGGGGRGIYALDVTEPDEFDEDDVMWELTAEDDPDIGYTYGEPVITRLNDDAGTWVAIFGNGYNSQDLQAHLFVVRLSDGEILQKIPVGNAGANGLSGVAALRDVNEQTHVDRIYAGDLEGTMWRFDFEKGKASVTYESGLYSSGRPIVSRPALTLHPSGGVLVYFGTGKLIEKADKKDRSLERFYGIRDRGKPVEWGDLASSASGGGVGGWYISLDTNGENGEKTFGPPRIGFGGYVTFATFEPVNDACSPGGLQRLFLRDSLTGAGEEPPVIGSGAPISPPITIRPPGGPGAKITFPGKPEDYNGEDPDFPEPPELTNGTPDEWCSVIELPPLGENADWTRLGSICEGRQIWREVR